MRHRFALLVLALAAVACSNGPERPEPADHFELQAWESGWGWSNLGFDDLDRDWDPPEGVDLLGGDGDLALEEINPDGGDPIEDLDLGSVARIRPDGDGGYWLLAFSILVHVEDGVVTSSHPAARHRAMALSAAPDGSAVIPNSHYQVQTVGGDGDNPEPVSLEEVPTALAYMPDGTLVAGGERITGLPAGGTVVELVRLVDHNGIDWVAFVAAFRDGGLAYVRDRWYTREIWVSRGDEHRRIPGAEFQRVIHSLDVAPDGRLLITVGDKIQLVDIESGDRETVIDLEGAQGNLSAAIEGDDIVFLADGNLWRKEGALD